MNPDAPPKNLALPASTAGSATRRGTGLASYSTAFTISSMIFLASPNTIIVLSM